MLIFACALLSFYVFIDQIKTDWVAPVASKFPVGNWRVEGLFMLLLAYSIYRVTQMIRNNQVPTLNGILILVAGLALYWVTRRDGRFVYYGFSLPNGGTLAYLDVVVILSVPLWVPTAAYGQLNLSGSVQGILADDPDPAATPDFTGYGGLVNLIASRINGTTAGTSIAVGIFAPWGAGKTHLLNSLQAKLTENPTNRVSVFNPWRAGNVDGIVDDFFVTLAKALKPFNKSVAQDIRRYSKKLFGPGKDFASRTVDTVVEEFFVDESIDDRFRVIRKGILNSGRRFIFLVDDLDRMTGHEIMQVLKMVRNSANFGNLFFVVTLDLSYTLAAIAKTRSFSMEEEYLKKIFQLSITLPPVKRDSLAEKLRAILVPTKRDNVAQLDDVDKWAAIEQVINELRHKDQGIAAYGLPDGRSYLESMLENYRDLERFANAFSMSMELTEGEVNIDDLFILELIKVKSILVYEKLANRYILTYDGEDAHFKISNSALEKVCGGVNDKYGDFKRILDRLFQYDKTKGSRQISQRENFYLYFNYQLFGLLSLREFRQTLEKDWRTINDQFLKWWNKGASNNFDSILDGYTDFANREQFRKIAKVYINNYNVINFRIRANNMLYNVTVDNLNACFGNNTEYTNFIREIINDPDLPIYNRAAIAKEIVDPNQQYHSQVLMDTNEVMETIARQFKDYLDKAVGYSVELINFFYLNMVQSDGSSKAIPEAAEALRSYLRAKPENFDGFLNFLIRSYRMPNDGTFTFEPFTAEIFGSWADFDQALMAHQPISQGVKKVFNLIKLYKGEIINGQRYFSVLDNNDRTILMEHLVSTGQANENELKRRRPGELEPDFTV